MKKELLLVGLVMVVTLLLSTIPANAYHNPKSGNAIVCPKGSLQNAQPRLPALTGGPASG
jgi:hypothetical protein